MKKILSLFLSIVMLLSVTAGVDLSAYAGNYQNALWFMDDLKITQVPGGDYSHKGTQNFDVVGVKNNNIKAPFDCKIVKIYKGYDYGNTVVIESTSKVSCADGTTGYISMCFAHDNEISDLSVGKTFKQGKVFYQTGTYGNVTGRHSHVTVIKGKYKNDMWTKNSYGNYCSPNAVAPTKVLFITNSTNVVNTKGLTFKKITNPTTVKITFNGNGGTVLGSSSLSVEKGKSVGNSLPSAKCAGKTFNGWYNSSGTKRYTNNTGIKENINVYANWITNKSDLLKSHRVYRIVNTNSNMAIQANGSSNKASVSQQPKSNSYSQLWEVTNYSEGYYKFNVLNGRRTLDITGGSIGLRTPYQIFNDTGSDNQRFSLVDRGSFFSIHSKSTGRALDIKDTSKSAGAQLQSYYYHGGGAQQFIFEEYTTRRLTFCDNLSNNYLTSLESDKANSMYTSRDKSYLTVSTSRVSRIMTVKALKAGSASKSMTWETTCNRSHNFDFGASDTSKKYLIFRARSNVNGAKMNFRWGYDSSEPIASATLSNSWQVFCLPMQRTLSSGGNIHPWIDRACTIAFDNILLVDNTSDYNIHIDDSNTEKVLSVNSNNGKIGNNIPMPKTTKNGSHFVGWYTRRVGGTKVSEQSQMYTNQFFYAHWEPHNYSIIKVVSPTCTNRGYTTYTCDCGDSYVGDYVNVTGHRWNSGKVSKESTCTETGIKIYTCTACGTTDTETIAKKAHTYKVYVTKATTKRNGSVVTKCSICGEVKSKSTIYYPKTVTLSYTSYTYNGKVKTPTVTVKNSKGQKISSKNYTVSYSKGRKYVGKYSVKITFKGNYSGSKTLYFTIKPKSTSISRLTSGKKKFTVKWKKQSTQTTGYQIQYSTSSKFKSYKIVTVGSNKTTSKTISKLKAKKKYYVRVRTYKTVKANGKSTKIYSNWSKAKAVTTKK